MTRTEIRRVSPVLAEKWRKEMDSGALAVRIAEREGLDPRTVRIHVARARRARGTEGARGDLLRDALRRHQEDLTALAAALAHAATAPPVGLRVADGLPAAALADHLGRSPAGKALRRWLGLADTYPDIRQALWDRAAAEPVVAELRARGVGQDTSATDVCQLADGVPLEALRPVAFRVPDADAIVAQEQALLRACQTWPEFTAVAACVSEARAIGQGLSDALEVIRLRRYISGSCRYCPDAEGA
ncbi:MAG TPA: hypothetical protein VMW80_02860 [Candidatus Dormibacteraeota bacterium]|nr:hypothetical protein [Candidatus Dormibacteraeota bacterium]